MSCEAYKPLLMGYLDQELTSVETQRIELHLSECQGCCTDLSEFQKLKQVTNNMRVVMPDDRYWEGYWASVYNRLERKAGWILVSAGSIVLVSYVVYQIINEAFFDERIPFVLRMGVLALIAGLCTLLVSVIRERYFLAKSDKYERIKR